MPRRRRGPALGPQAAPAAAPVAVQAAPQLPALPKQVKDVAAYVADNMPALTSADAVVADILREANLTFEFATTEVAKYVGQLRTEYEQAETALANIPERMPYRSMAVQDRDKKKEDFESNMEALKRWQAALDDRMAEFRKTMVVRSSDLLSRTLMGPLRSFGLERIYGEVASEPGRNGPWGEIVQPITNLIESAQQTERLRVGAILAKANGEEFDEGLVCNSVDLSPLRDGLINAVAQAHALAQQVITTKLEAKVEENIEEERNAARKAAAAERAEAVIGVLESKIGSLVDGLSVDSGADLDTAFNDLIAQLLPNIGGNLFFLSEEGSEAKGQLSGVDFERLRVVTDGVDSYDAALAQIPIFTLSRGYGEDLMEAAAMRGDTFSDAVSDLHRQAVDVRACKLANAFASAALDCVLASIEAQIIADFEEGKEESTQDVCALFNLVRAEIEINLTAKFREKFLNETPDPVSSAGEALIAEEKEDDLAGVPGFDDQPTLDETASGEVQEALAGVRGGAEQVNRGTAARGHIGEQKARAFAQVSLAGEAPAPVVSVTARPEVAPGATLIAEPDDGDERSAELVASAPRGRSRTAEARPATRPEPAPDMEAAPQQPASKPASKKRSLLPWFAGGVGLAFIAVCGGSVTYFAGSSKSTVDGGDANNEAAKVLAADDEAGRTVIKYAGEIPGSGGIPEVAQDALRDADGNLPYAAVLFDCASRNEDRTTFSTVNWQASDGEIGWSNGVLEGTEFSIGDMNAACDEKGADSKLLVGVEAAK